MYRPASHSREILEVVEVIYRRLGFVLILVLMACVPAIESTAAAWPSFKLADFDQIYITPQLGGSQTSYTLELGAHPTITFEGNTYAVNWIQTVYVVAEPKTAPFTATEGSNSKGWSWDDKSGIAGYDGTGGSNRLYPEESMTFSFNQFQAAPGSVLAGFHLGYQDGGSEETDWFKGNPVPEPSALISLAVPMAALAFRRKWRAR